MFYHNWLVVRALTQEVGDSGSSSSPSPIMGLNLHLLSTAFYPPGHKLLGIKQSPHTSTPLETYPVTINCKPLWLKWKDLNGKVSTSCRSKDLG